MGVLIYVSVCVKIFEETFCSEELHLEECRSIKQTKQSQVHTTNSSHYFKEFGRKKEVGFSLKRGEGKHAKLLGFAQ